MDRGHERIAPITRNLAPLKFFAHTVLFQLIAFGVTIFANQNVLGPLLSGALADSPIWTVMLLTLDGGTAAILCRLWRMPLSWTFVNALLPAAILCSFALPGQLIALAVIVTALIYIPTFWTRVPFYPTSRRTYDAVADLLPADRPFCFIDLGCGFASLLCHLADRFPKGRFAGVEIGPLPWLVAKIRSLFRRNLAVSYESLWRADLSRYDVVYTFLAPGPMDEVWQKVRAEMPAGGMFITNCFPPSRPCDSTVTVEDGRTFILYIYNL